MFTGLLVGLVVGIGGMGFYAATKSGTAAPDTSARVSGPGQSAGANRSGRRGYAPAVTVAIAETANVEKRIDVIGEARALRSVTITSEVTGLVDEVIIAPGRRVAQDDVLMRIESAEQEIAYRRAKAQFPIAKANADRYQRLVKEDAASALEADDAFNAYKAAEAELSAAELSLKQREVAAPFDGISGLTSVEAGDYIRAGDVISTLDDTSSVVIEFSVPQEAAAYVDIGQQVSARIASGEGRTFDGVISAIDSRVDAVSRTLSVEATFGNPDRLLIPGSVFAVSTSSPQDTAVSVPGLAVQWDRAGAYVWKRDTDGKAKRAPITILQRRDEVVLIAGDIESGDIVVSEGSDRVRSGIELPIAERQRGGSTIGSAASSSVN